MTQLTATIAVDLPPRVDLHLVRDLDTSQVTITRVHADGTTHKVRGAEPALIESGYEWDGADYEAPFSVDFHYLATEPGPNRRTVGRTPTLQLQPSQVGYYPNDQGWTTARGAVWLRHLGKPTLSMRVDLANVEPLDFASSRSVQTVVGRRSAIVSTDTRRKNPTSTLDIRTWSLEESAALRELLDDNTPLLLSVPAGERWGLTHWYVTVGDVSEERLIQDWAPFEGRVFHLPFEVVDRPAGGRVYPACCYWAVERGVGTLADLDAAYPTYADMAVCDATGGNTPPPSSGETQLLSIVDYTPIGSFPQDERVIVLSGGPVTLDTDHTYLVSAGLLLAPDAGTQTAAVNLEVLLQPGPTASESGGENVAMHGQPVLSVPNTIDIADSAFTPQAAGDYLVTTVAYGDLSWTAGPYQSLVLKRVDP